MQQKGKTLNFYTIYLVIEIFYFDFASRSKIFSRRQLKKSGGPTEIRTRINGFKARCAHRYTIEPLL